MTNSESTPTYSENRLENCIKMELNFNPIPSESRLHGVQTRPKQLSLILNIHFGEHTELLEDGKKITFGLKRGELRIVSLINGEIKLENIKLVNSFQIEVEKETQIEKSKESQVTARVSLNPGGDTARKEGNKESEKIKYKEHQVKLKWEQNNPLWLFEAKTDTKLLQGLLQNCEIAIIDLKQIPCKLIAAFDIIKADILITNSDSLLVNNLSKIKIAVIEKGIIRLLEKKIKLKSYLSRVDLTYG